MLSKKLWASWKIISNASEQYFFPWLSLNKIRKHERTQSFNSDVLEKALICEQLHLYFSANKPNNLAISMACVRTYRPMVDADRVRKRAVNETALCIGLLEPIELDYTWHLAIQTKKLVHKVCHVPGGQRFVTVCDRRWARVVDEKCHFEQMRQHLC